jgi:hypothetical protein
MMDLRGQGLSLLLPAAEPWLRQQWMVYSGEGRLAMQTVFIRFLTQDNRVRGFCELATRVSSLTGEYYQVPIDALRLLETQHIGYRKATNAEVVD